MIGDSLAELDNFEYNFILQIEDTREEPEQQDESSVIFKNFLYAGTFFAILWKA